MKEGEQNEGYHFFLFCCLLPQHREQPEPRGCVGGIRRMEKTPPISFVCVRVGQGKSSQTCFFGFSHAKRIWISFSGGNLNPDPQSWQPCKNLHEEKVGWTDRTVGHLIAIRQDKIVQAFSMHLIEIHIQPCCFDVASVVSWTTFQRRFRLSCNTGMSWQRLKISMSLTCGRKSPGPVRWIQVLHCYHSSRSCGFCKPWLMDDDITVHLHHHDDHDFLRFVTHI
jgi:hypothetical protein